MFKIFILLFFFIFCQTVNAQNWNPKKTWVFVIGVLEWQDKDNLPSFDKRGRIDGKLFNYLQKSGVPATQMIYIQDLSATTQDIQKQLTAFASKGGTEDTFFFYYCGHGYRTHDKTVCFASYDCNEKRNWTVSSIVKVIHDNFKGKTIFLTADCCNSGALAQEVKKYTDKTIFALSSVVPTDISTGNWTFSNALLSGLRGDNFVDTDNDKIITVKELAEFTDAEMAIVEKQKAAYYIPANADNYVITANVPTKSNKRIGERVNVKYEGVDWLGRIIASKDNLFNVRFYSYTNNETDWVKPENCIPYTVQSFPVGTTIEVLWKDKKRYAAKILKTANGLHYVKYEGYGDEDNEWVAFEKIRKK